MTPESDNIFDASPEKPGSTASNPTSPNPGAPVSGHEPGWDTEADQNDPLWQLLGKASQPEPSALFTRNVVREARQLQDGSTGWGDRFISFFTPHRLAKITLAGAACACALVAYQMWPVPETTVTNPTPDTPVPGEPTSALAELVIEESLDAAAEDPTLFTRDEVVAMIGF